MGLRHWLRNHMLGDDAVGNDVPPNASLVNTMLGREAEPTRALGEFDAGNYPEELSALLRRRAEVASDLLKIDIADPQARIAAIPQLKELLRKYPHPLAYETLIHAYVDAGRFDEAKGVAFAARERRMECARSPHPEIRAETDRLAEWSSEEIDEMRQESEARGQKYSG